MKFEQIKEESSESFRRLTGIKRTTFDVMINILKEAESALKAKGGKPNKLSTEDRLLMALEYLREYRTYFHISRSYGISESACYRNIRWIEDTLSKMVHSRCLAVKPYLKAMLNMRLFLLMQQKVLLNALKKTKALLFREKEKTHVKDTNYCRQKTKENYLHKFFEW